MKNKTITKTKQVVKTTAKKAEEKKVTKKVKPIEEKVIVTPPAPVVKKKKEVVKEEKITKPKNTTAKKVKEKTNLPEINPVKEDPTALIDVNTKVDDLETKELKEDQQVKSTEEEAPKVDGAVDYDKLIPSGDLAYYLRVVRDTILSESHFYGNEERSGTHYEKLIDLIKRNDFIAAQVNLYDKGDNMLVELINNGLIAQIEIRKSINGCSGIII